MRTIKDIATPTRTNEILKKHGLVLKKSLGQNFLVESNVIQQVIRKANITKQTAVIEVGPGIGSLTEQLARTAGHVIAFEIDQRLIPILNDTLSPYDNITLINEDILEADISAAIETHLAEFDEVIVVANLPYYITTPILMHFLESGLDIKRYYVMMQKEVGERISARPGTKSYGSLSIAIDFYTEARTIQDVPKTVFMPPPNVDSIIIELIKRDTPKVDVESPEVFFKLTRGGFVQRRKTILNCYQTIFENGKKEKDAIRRLLAAAEIEENRRGESLSIEEYYRIYKAYQLQNTLKLL
ncbi:dimethyladenosine transferase [Aliicoccus persicus]|uniref:Ribosomal RNA small subunit methyltransferase A n=1 Tax=Aliicoccus persicus TaxID=930138 RepID=A0A662Z3R4_9STAP|nr:dimethyladenosine transferase [Aliicoccus persicus]